GGVALLSTGVPGECWATIGQKAALAAVGLQQDEEAAARLSEKLTRLPAGAEGTAGQQPLPEHEWAGQQPMPEPTAPQNEQTAAVPQADGTGGRVVEQVVAGGQQIAGLWVKNKSGVTVDLPAALKAPLPFEIEINSPAPQVLIYHTHTTEGYMPYDAGYYNQGDVRRDPTYPHNVTLVGDAIEAELTAAGITVLHITEIYDHPNYRGAYERSEAMMREMLKKYPSIKVTLDIHRDGLMATATDKLKPTVTVAGRKAAQMMLVCGVLDTAALPHPNWRNNLAFAARLQGALAADYDQLMRPLSLTGARYNQFLAPGALLVEVGSEGNTLEEALYSGHLLGKRLAELLKEG
ncbi:MAG: stage II sporulation protein P, partial [Clostridia bacterium]|nr:stage II sporulation protein P [Clostridia bacterium]